MLQKTISAVRPETWEQINRALLSGARQAKLEDGVVVRLEPQKLVSYLGLNPSVRQSGPGPASQGRITIARRKPMIPYGRDDGSDAALGEKGAQSIGVVRPCRRAARATGSMALRSSSAIITSCRLPAAIMRTRGRPAVIARQSGKRRQRQSG